jgi:hypothetical protein
MKKKVSNLAIKACSRYERKGWLLNNGTISVFVMKGGGHIAGLFLEGEQLPTPLWIPKWGTIEPDMFEKNRSKNIKKYGSKLLACISGHNLCSPYFGDPSQDEARAGMNSHGEAPIANWKLEASDVAGGKVKFTISCKMEEANMSIKRSLMMKEKSNCIEVKDVLINDGKRDKPFTMCHHVTFSDPFLEENITRFDMAVAEGCTYQGAFSDRQRLKENVFYKWPYCPASSGGNRNIDLRYMSEDIYSDFHTNLIDRKLDKAWFTAYNPRSNVIVAYVWNRKDFPWVGVWEEHYCRAAAPWNKKEFTRGMEFANSPFPQSLRQAVDMNVFQNEKTFAWLPAEGERTFEYDIFYFHPPAGVKGVKKLQISNTKKLNIDYQR